MHRDWSGKYCPHRILEAGNRASFVSRVAARVSAPEALELAAKIGRQVVFQLENDAL